MIYVKLIVFLMCFYETFPYNINKYCKICLNHILCKYNIAGPSSICKNYDKNALLTKHDINEIVNRINERRNFVALGLSKKLPHAANMRKIEWSEDLAMFAQRWADQCNSNLRPDIQDECRDLDQMEVGQNIVTVLNPSLKLNVKSLIDIWYMQILHYTGSVSYYSQSLKGTDSFTQLIWAETEMVGCGKAKFSINNGKSFVERLICNFAPKGNIHGKTVYAIGFPGTQCPGNMMRDNRLRGLCKHKLGHNDEKIISTAQTPPVSNPLGILNLSNNSLKQEIDPIRIHFKQIKVNGSEINDQRYQKIRHIFSNNTHGVVGHIPPVHVQSHWASPKNMSRNYAMQHQLQESGHSRIHHEYIYTNNFQSKFKGNTNQDFRRHHYTTESMNSNHDYRRENYKRCTRKGATDESCINSSYTTKHCTRGAKNDCLHTTPTAFEQHISRNTFEPLFTTKYHVVPQELCSCNTKYTTCPTTTLSRCTCDINCQCGNRNIPLTRFPNILRNQDSNINPETKLKSEFHYYDLLPHLNIRSGDSADDDLSLRNSNVKNGWLSEINEEQKGKTMTYKKYIKNGFDYSKAINEHKEYLRASLDYGERKKRQYGDQLSFRPFWETDHLKKTPQSKFLRYTTLSHRKNKKLEQTQHLIRITTEPITIAYKKISVDDSMYQPITEKYLSFEELLHLKKSSSMDNNYPARRLADTDVLRDAKTNQPTKSPSTTSRSTTTKKITASTTVSTTTQEVTANTPFVRKKHCTRKLTCTWTAPTVTNSDGKVIIHDGGGGGSKTPSGYVEGCTRTSTCTRDYMNRNKMPTVTDDISTEITVEDEDYCERRSLNVQRRNSDDLTKQSVEHQVDYTETSTFSTDFSYDTQVMSIKDTKTFGECTCDDLNLRKKRDNIQMRCTRENARIKTYNQLFYSVVNKIVTAWKNNSLSQVGKCFCNSCSVTQIYKELLAIFIFFCLFLSQ